MVGDGVNDSPSLAAAALGFSMVAPAPTRRRKRADVLYHERRPAQVPETIRPSKKTYAVLWQNISACAGHQGGVLRPGSVRQRHHVDGSVRGHGCEPSRSSTVCRLLRRRRPLIQAYPRYTFSYAPLRRLLALHCCCCSRHPGLQLPTIASMRKSHSSKVRILATMRIRMLRPETADKPGAKSLLLLPTLSTGIATQPGLRCRR